MKNRLICLILSICLIITAFSASVFASEAAVTYCSVYLDTAAAIDGDGTENSPFKTLDAAITAIEASTQTAGIINIVGTFTSPSTVPTHKKEITFCGADDEAKFYHSTSVVLGGPTVFENIIFQRSGWCFIRAAGNPLTFSNGVQMVSNGSINIDAGADVSGKDINLKLLSGKFNSVYIGSYSDSDTTINSANVFIGENAVVTLITLGANGKGGCTFQNDVFMTINGELEKMIYTTKGSVPVFKGAFTVLYNHGLYRLYEVSETLTAEKGVYTVSCEKKEGSCLEMTDTVGLFNVIGDNDAVAVSSATGSVSEASNKTFRFGSAGKYTVKFPQSDIEYLNGGAELRVKKDTTLDFRSISYIEPDGKLFVGWTDADGSAVTSGEFAKGAVLYAKYIDYADKDFYIKDTQIRTATHTGDKNQGLRFIIERKNTFDSAFKAAVGDISYGAIYMPTDYASGTDMEIDSSHELIKDVYYMPKKVEAKNIYSKTSSAQQYTLCITDTGSELTKDKYYKFYTVKGYIEYTDINGVERVLYTDYITTNLYKTALEEAEANPDNYDEICDTIINYVENGRITEKTTGDGEFAFSGNYFKGDATTDLNYTIKLLNNKLRVRDIVIGNADDSEPINIIAFSDLHFNNYNKQDELLDNPSAKAQWYGVEGIDNSKRIMGRVDYSFGNVENANKLMEYGSFYDKTVIIGDVMDYFSYGCAELVKKLLVDRIVNGNTLMALGNHETSELFANVKKEYGFRDMFTQEYKYAKLNEQLWPHDIYYYSEVVTKGDKQVRVVVIDNQKPAYNSSIYNKLLPDINASRDDNIPILIFQHVPMNTGNEADTQIVPFSDGATTSTGYMSFYNNSGYIGGNYSNADTNKVYDLICSSADVIKGVFCGHEHNAYYVNIKATDKDGNAATIPQYVVSGSYMKDKGEALKISVY